MILKSVRPSVSILSTSIGPGGGANVLDTAVRSGQFFGYDVRASLAIPRFQDSFDSDTATLTDPDLDAQLRAALTTLAINEQKAVA